VDASGTNIGALTPHVTHSIGDCLVALTIAHAEIARDCARLTMNCASRQTRRSAPWFVPTMRCGWGRRFFVRSLERGMRNMRRVNSAHPRNWELGQIRITGIGALGRAMKRCKSSLTLV